MTQTSDVILRADAVSRHYALTGRHIRRNAPVLKAVDGVTCALAPRTTLGVVGESGSGKSTLAKLLLRLEKPTSGRVDFRGRDVHAMPTREVREYRSAVQAVFQDPSSALNPRLRIRTIVAEPILGDGRSRRAVTELVAQQLEAVGLPAGAPHHYPHEFSGGQRQRIAIARALVSDPEVIVLDEPISSLDVSIALQVLNLLGAIQEARNVSYLYISHSIGSVRYLSQYIIVMYFGRVVEEGSAKEIFGSALHPYTQALLASSRMRAEGIEADRLAGEAPSNDEAMTGCVFRTRCAHAHSRCELETPVLQGSINHRVACHLHG